MKLKELYGIPYIVAVRNTDMNTFFRYMIHLRSTGIKILKEAEQVIFLSDSYKRKLLKEYVSSNLEKNIKEKIEIIPNGIDDFWFENKGVQKNINKNEIKLLYIGEINKNKNILTTIKAVEMLVKKYYNVTFTVVGKIIDENVYKEIKKYSFVYYRQPMPKEKLLNFYRSHDIFVMPSRYETFGLVYAESMSQGTPVIYSKNQGFDNQFKDGEVGYRVTYDSVNEISDRIIDIIKDYNKLSLNCINKSSKFFWNKIFNAYDNIYNGL